MKVIGVTGTDLQWKLFITRGWKSAWYLRSKHITLPVKTVFPGKQIKFKNVVMRMVCKQLSLVSSELSCCVCVPGTMLTGVPSRFDALIFSNLHYLILQLQLVFCSSLSLMREL